MERDHNAWLRRAQEIAKLGNWDQDPVSGNLWWSDQTYTLFGLDPQSETMTFETFLQMVHPDDRVLIEERTSLALSAEAVPYKLEYRLKDADSRDRHVYEEAIVERNEDGEPTRMVGIIQDISERKETELEREKLIQALRQALAEVKTLRGIIPICANCKKIRDEEGYWTQVEEYIRQNTEAAFSHGICDDCVSKLYPEFC